MFLITFYLIYCIAVVFLFNDVTLNFYYLAYFYNIIYVEDIAYLLFCYYFSSYVLPLLITINFFNSTLIFFNNMLIFFNLKLYFLYNILKAEISNFLLIKFTVYQTPFLMVSFYVFFKFFFRNLALFGASLRREDWFVYQEWFRVAKNLTPRQMQVQQRLIALSNNEFNNLLRKFSIDLVYHDDGYNEETGYYEDVEPDESDFSRHHHFKDVYKALYYYFLTKNEERVAKNAVVTKNTLYYKERYGTEIFSYLTLKQDDKMAKFSSVKTSREQNENA
jgi:hypothetical protein